MRHMRKLMAAAAAIGVASVTTRGTAQPGAADGDVGNAAPPDAGPGYMVVDPSPALRLRWLRLCSKRLNVDPITLKGERPSGF